MNIIQVDLGLTPDNCEERGYKWWGDSIYDPEAPGGVNDNFIEMVNDGWKLGKSASSVEENGGVGLYKPINVTEKP